jgi:hypothetical protein
LLIVDGLINVVITFFVIVAFRKLDVPVDIPWNQPNFLLSKVTLNLTHDLII